MSGYQVYQGNQINSAGPLGLVLLTHQALIKSLGQARLAIINGDIAAEADHISKAMEALIELSSSLNMEGGGDVARSLATLYVYMMNKLTEGLCSCSTDHVDEIIQLVQKLGEGWMELSAQQNSAYQEAA